MKKKEVIENNYNLYKKRILYIGFISLFFIIITIISMINHKKSIVFENLINEVIQKKELPISNFNIKVISNNKVNCSTYINSKLNAETICKLKDPKLVIPTNNKFYLLAESNEVELKINTEIFEKDINIIFGKEKVFKLDINNLNIKEDIFKKIIGINKNIELTKLIKDSIKNINIDILLKYNFLQKTDKANIYFKYKIDSKFINYEQESSAIMGIKKFYLNENFSNVKIVSKNLDKSKDIYYDLYKLSMKSSNEKNNINKNLLNIDSNKIISKEEFNKFFKEKLNIYIKSKKNNFNFKYLFTIYLFEIFDKDNIGFNLHSQKTNKVVNNDNLVVNINSGNYKINIKECKTIKDCI